jgi:hypothetical protein
VSALDIKIRLIKMFVKAMDKESEGFDYLRQNFPQNSGAKKREGVFVGPQVTQLFEHQDFSTKLNATERTACKAFEIKSKRRKSGKSQ